MVARVGFVFQLGALTITRFNNNIVAQLIIYPPTAVSALGETVTFYCVSDEDISDIEWQVNDSVVPRRVLTLTNLTLDYNMTRIRCRAVSTSSGITLTSPTGTLLLQGKFL